MEPTSRGDALSCTTAVESLKMSSFDSARMLRRPAPSALWSLDFTSSSRSASVVSTVAFSVLARTCKLKAAYSRMTAMELLLSANSSRKAASAAVTASFVSVDSWCSLQHEYGKWARRAVEPHW